MPKTKKCYSKTYLTKMKKHWASASKYMNSMTKKITKLQDQHSTWLKNQTKFGSSNAAQIKKMESSCTKEELNEIQQEAKKLLPVTEMGKFATIITKLTK